MDHELELAVARALGVARACIELATDAISDGHFPKALGQTIARNAQAGAVDIRSALDHVRGQLPADLRHGLYQTSIDLETAEALAGFAHAHNVVPANTVHIARALLYIAEKTSEALASAERRLRQPGLLPTR